MRCRDVEALCSGYVDGELDERRASALRGHLRVCPDCLARVEDEAALRDAAADLDPVEPPAALWDGIEARLAQAEIDDAERSRLWLWWQGARGYAMPVAVAAAAVVALLVWSRHRGAETASRPAPSRSVAVAPRPDRAPTPTPAPVADGESFLEQRGQELAQSDADYLQVMAELKQVVAQERARWSAELADEFDRKLSQFEAEARHQRQTLAVNDVPDPASRDALYTVYRAEIGFLQRAALGELR